MYTCIYIMCYICIRVRKSAGHIPTYTCIFLNIYIYTYMYIYNRQAIYRLGKSLALRAGDISHKSISHFFNFIF